MTVKELIRKYDLIIMRKGDKVGIGIGRKVSKKQIEELKEKKDEIIAELLRREAAREEAEARMEAERQEELRAIRAGEKTIKLSWYDGCPLSGWQVFGPATELLEELGLAEMVAGWGHLVDHRAVKALGNEFTYQQAVEYTQPAREAKEQTEAKKTAERQAKFDEARETGKSVLLQKWTEPCNDPKEECSLDIVRVYAMPDGTQKVERVHTY